MMKLDRVFYSPWSIYTANPSHQHASELNTDIALLEIPYTLLTLKAPYPL